ncbi:MAG: hypothetical protein IAI50_07755, partial [Candidatus Eremiobacteraeota bacterium]|nr:hypothetical protein [Candidatus Eremiobacteraeota bacterium]
MRKRVTTITSVYGRSGSDPGAMGGREAKPGLMNVPRRNLLPIVTLGA